ncbi:MAG: hypothetical protein VR75_04860 [Hyphomonadaceae bacterium BRH_c29]|nr:MAG: hypothetical protein VR75_04860 [Hyphomonadaceae bacterium BRH_c29]
MSLIWWILPAISGVIGLMLLFAGFGKLASLKPLSGGSRLIFGVGFFGLALVVAFAGLNLQTYKRLKLERDAAHIRFDAVAGQPVTFEATLQIWPEEKPRPPYILHGDEFSIGAQVIKFKPLANMLGYDSVYRFDYLEGRFADRYSTKEVSKAEATGIKLYVNPGFDVRRLAAEQGARFGLEDAQFGSAVYMPMGDGYEFDVSITQDALVVRPTEATRLLMQRAAYPGYQPGVESPK